MAYLREHEEHAYSMSSIFYMENTLGRIMVKACDACDHVDVFCEHIRNHWSAKLSRICDLCGGDGK